MSKVQFIRTPKGESLAVLPRAEYEALAKVADRYDRAQLRAVDLQRTNIRDVINLRNHAIAVIDRSIDDMRNSPANGAGVIAGAEVIGGVIERNGARPPSRSRSPPRRRMSADGPYGA